MEASSHHQRKEKEPRVHRPCAFDKMEGLVREMQDPENGVPVRSKKQFLLTSIPSAFMGYDLIEWLMERLAIEESVEAVHIANQLCQYGYFFPVNDSKTLTVKDDSSLYRFQTPYYWPWQHRTPDNVEYAIYLAKRTLRNKQRHALEDYEIEALNSLRKNLQNKWDVIQLQAEEQVRLSKERKKGDKIVSDSQERAFWRIYRPPPGCLSSLEVVPVPTRFRPGVPHPPPRKRTLTDLQREVALLRNSLTRTRIKVSAAIENLKSYYETYMEYDPMFVQPQPSNPWITDDQTFWQINSPLVEVPTEKRVKRWALSMEEIMSDPTGLQEFTNYLRKEYSHENIRFWLAVKDLRHSYQAQIPDKVNEIFKEFLAPGAPCEINIDGKTMEKVHQEMKNPSRYTFDAAVEHVYTLLLKKDCYPRFIRSDHYRNLLAAGIQPSQKKRFFGFGGPGRKKTSSAAMPMTGTLQQQHANVAGGSRRRGSDRSLSGSAHELAVCGVRDVTSTAKVPHSHSQSNLTDIPYRDAGAAEVLTRPTNDVCPWDAITGQQQSAESVEGIGPTKSIDEGQEIGGRTNIVVSQTSVETIPVASSSATMATSITSSSMTTTITTTRGERTSRKNSSQFDSCSSSSDASLAIAEVSERLKKSCHFVGSTPPVTRNYSAGSTSVRVKLSEIGRTSVASCSYASPRQSFEVASSSPIVVAAEVASIGGGGGGRMPSSAPSIDDTSTSDAGIPTVAVTVTSSSIDKTSPAKAPLISIGAIIDEPTSEETIATTVEAQAATEDPPQVVPVWEPDVHGRDDESADATVAATCKKRDNKVNEVCPWEDEENCRVDAPYVKTYATLGYL